LFLFLFFHCSLRYIGCCFLFLAALVSCYFFLFFLFAQFFLLLRTTEGLGQQEVPETTGGIQDNRRLPGQQEGLRQQDLPVTTGGAWDSRRHPGKQVAPGATGVPGTTEGAWDNQAFSSLCLDHAYLCFTQSGEGIFCTGRLLIVILFLAVMSLLFIVFVLLLFFEILQTDCTTSRFTGTGW